MHEIRPLTSLRGLAALVVVAYHASVAAGVDVVPHGYLAVDLFFILSGFVLTLTAADGYAARGWRAHGGFLARRVARILPLNVFVVFAIVAANLAAHGGAGAPVGRAACNAVALQGFGMCVTLNAPAWTLSFEWLAYLLFPLALGATLLSRPALCALCVAIAVAALMVFASISGRGTLDSSQFSAGWSAIRCLGEMVIGIACARAYASPRGRAALSSDAALWLVIVAGAAACVACERHVTWWVGGDVWAIAAFPALIVCLAANTGLSGTWLGRAPWHGLGVISFSIYLLHDPILQREARAMAAWRPDWMTHRAMAGLFVALAPVPVIPLAWVTNRLIERPGRAAVRRLLSRGAAERAGKLDASTPPVVRSR